MADFALSELLSPLDFEHLIRDLLTEELGIEFMAFAEGPDGGVDLGLMRLVAHFASRAAGCQYCEAHSLVAAKIHDVPQDKLDAIWEYQTSPLYSDAERVALDFAMAAGSVPNAADAELFARMREHWSEAQIVQILGAVCLYGFLNRWNDTMATDLEDEPRKMAERVLTKGGWTGGKHV